MIVFQVQKSKTSEPGKIDSVAKQMRKQKINEGDYVIFENPGSTAQKYVAVQMTKESIESAKALDAQNIAMKLYKVIPGKSTATFFMKDGSVEQGTFVKVNYDENAVLKGPKGEFEVNMQKVASLSMKKNPFFK
jgi:hypothetical protein